MMLVEETAPEMSALPVAGLRAHLQLGSGFAVPSGAGGGGTGSQAVGATEGELAETRALAGFLRAAIATIEARTGKVLLRRVYRMRLSDWRDRMVQPLPLAPVVAVVSVEIEDRRGAVHAVDPEDFLLVADRQRPVLRPVGAMLPNIPQGGAVEICFTAGFGDTWDQVPADLAQAVMMLAARYYEDRSFEGSVAAMPFGVSALIERWRSVRLFGGGRSA